MVSCTHALLLQFSLLGMFLSLPFPNTHFLGYLLLRNVASLQKPLLFSTGSGISIILCLYLYLYYNCLYEFSPYSSRSSLRIEATYIVYLTTMIARNRCSMYDGKMNHNNECINLKHHSRGLPIFYKR